MDHGKLTDHNGKRVDFQNVILIMTTNAGASDLAKAAIGFNRAKREGDDEEAINRLFSPEFRNRLDAVITFANLPPEVIAKVVEKFVFQLEAQLGDRNITIELTPEANAWLAERGYDDKFGARPLARVIQEHIKKPLAEEILFGALKDGGIVRVLVEEKAGEKVLGFEYLKADAPMQPARSRGYRSRRRGARWRRTERPTEGGRTQAAGAARGLAQAAGSRQRSVGASLVPKVPLGTK